MRQIYPSQNMASLPTGAPLQPEAAVEHDNLQPWPQSSTPRPPRRSHLRRFRFLYLGILAILLLIFAPPLVNFGRYQRSIATSIGNSLGRPVHLDRVSLTLLPLPGFTIENLVVGEDPAFGNEPIIRAQSVQATLRFSSLWRRHVEFSTISFTDPSVNLVHAADGRWNIEGILLQASRIDTAPTAQRHAGAAPRFPYIEATGARLNFKQEQEKLPFSLVDSDFALWLPDPHQWHLRLRARPTRTDSNVSDTGIIDLESTLGAAPSLAQVPLNLQGQWHDAPLGEATRVIFGHDAGWRGVMNLTANIRGTFGESAVTTRLNLVEARPSDFVPEKPISAQAECYATATGLFHAFQDVRCSWPPELSAHGPGIALTGSIPNVHRVRDSSFQLGTSGIPASTLLAWLRATSPKVPSDLTATGVLSGSLTYEGSDPKAAPSTTRDNRWLGQLTLSDATLKAPLSGKASTPAENPIAQTVASAVAGKSATGNLTATLLSQDVHLHFATQPTPSRRHGPVSTQSSERGFLLAPTQLQLGGLAPATLEGRFSATGYTLHLTGSVTEDHLRSLAQALPPLGDGLMKALPPDHPDTAPFHVDLTATRNWHGPQVWKETLRTETQPSRHVRRHAQ